MAWFLTPRPPAIDPRVPVAEPQLGWWLVVALCALSAWLTPWLIPYPEWAGPRPWWGGGRTRASVTVAAVLLIPGVLLALSAIRTLGRRTTLVSTGPYRWVRHPYYLAILLLLVGTLIALRSVPAAVLLVPAVHLTLARARAEEHNLEIRLGDEWREYARRVPFLLPLAPPLPPEGMAAVRAAEGEKVLKDLDSD